jgi:hypothetical protein
MTLLPYQQGRLPNHNCHTLPLHSCAHMLTSCTTLSNIPPPYTPLYTMSAEWATYFCTLAAILPSAYSFMFTYVLSALLHRLLICYACIFFPPDLPDRFLSMLRYVLPLRTFALIPSAYSCSQILLPLRTPIIVSFSCLIMLTKALLLHSCNSLFTMLIYLFLRTPYIDSSPPCFRYSPSPVILL